MIASYEKTIYKNEDNGFCIWTIVNKVDTIYKEKCRVQLLSAVPSTILLFHLVSSFRENYAVSWHYRILRCIRTQITGVPAENDMFYGLTSSFLRYLKKHSQQALSKGYPFLENDCTTFRESNNCRNANAVYCVPLSE